MDSGSGIDRYDVYEEGPLKRTPLSSFRYFDDKADVESLRRSLMCRSRLLQAGADPTLELIFRETIQGYDIVEIESIVRETMHVPWRGVSP